MMRKILIVTHRRDDCARMVIARLKKMKAPFVRFDTDTFHDRIRFVNRIDKTGAFLGRYLFKDGTVLDFDAVGVIWNRRIHEPRITRSTRDISYDQGLKEWARSEADWAMNNSFTLIPAPMVNPWEVNERLKFNKLVQMRRAAELGLAIPDSCVTDDPDSMQEFWDLVGHDMVIKKIRQGIIRVSRATRQLIAHSLISSGNDPESAVVREAASSTRRLLHTTLISPDMFSNQFVHELRFCPVFFQRHVRKKYDIRSIVVGDRVFSFAIHSQNTLYGKTDYRTEFVRHPEETMRHSVIDLGEEMNGKLLAFCRSFGLTFSAIDLIETPDGNIVFLEDNPNGQWAWLEHETGTPLSLAFAELLTDMVRSEA